MRPQLWPARLGRWGAYSCVLLGLVLRLSVVHEWNTIQPNSPARLAGDEVEYNAVALDVLHGKGYDWPSRVPLYPLWLVGQHWLLGESYAALAYAQALLGLLVIPLTYTLGRRCFGTTAALLSALW